MATNYNLSLYAGDSYSKTIAFTDTEGAIDKTGFTYAAQIRANPFDDVVLVDIEIDETDLDEGVIVLTIPATQVTNALDNASWDLEQLSDAATPVVKTMLTGKVHVQPDTTR